MYPYLGDYYKYKKIIPFPFWLKGCRFTKQKFLLIYFFQDYEWENELRFVRIFFDTATFDRIEKDRAAKFVDQLSARDQTIWQIIIFFHSNKILGLIYPIRDNAHGFFALKC